MSIETSLEKYLIPFFASLDKRVKLSVYSNDFDFYMFRIFFPNVQSVKDYTSDSVCFVNIEEFDTELLKLHYIIIIRNIENKNIELNSYEKNIIKRERYGDFTIFYVDQKSIESKEENKEVNNIVECSYVCTLFPKKPGVDTTKIKISTVGLYSVTSSRFNDKIVSIILENNNNNRNISIMDCTACVGGDSIGFALAFDRVVSLEKDSVNYQCLVNNIGLYNLKNIIALNFDFLDRGYDIIETNKPSVLYFDPPWGGRDYYLHDKIELFLNEKNIKDIISDIFNKYEFIDFCVIKAPSNYNIKETQNVKIYDLKKFNVVVFKR